MATRRNVGGYSEKRISSPTDESPPQLQPKPGSKDTSPAVPGSVIAKLVIFTAAMITAPLGSYFFMLNVVTKGNSTLSGATAAIVANIVLITYVIVALREDDDDSKKKR